MRYARVSSELARTTPCGNKLQNGMRFFVDKVSEVYRDDVNACVFKIVTRF